ncbi:hypothetical protein AWC38_SpisGene23095 [Stylophora pistillata]|uniref:Uncharacterized protein n=1 Tax=Stylophora pistillata TaxID=50429 RepID=A0A2B4R944_STYPI|nr:hypothetical protein AWC38_SpisGene23095 [Stylophora pistillata]
MKPGIVQDHYCAVYVNRKDTLALIANTAWVYPVVQGSQTDQVQEVNIEDLNEDLHDNSTPSIIENPTHKNSTPSNIEMSAHDSSDPIDENLPLASDDSINENLPLATFLPPPPQFIKSAEHESLPDLTALPPSEPSQPDPVIEQPSERPSDPVQLEELSQPSSAASHSPILDSEGLIVSKPPKQLLSRRTPARLSETSLACTRKATTPTLTTGKPRSSIPIPPASSISTPTASSTPPSTSEADMETSYDLKRKSSDLSPYLKEATPTEKKKGRNRHSKKSNKQGIVKMICYIAISVTEVRQNMCQLGYREQARNSI